jgi:hypothetical protein
VQSYVVGVDDRTYLEKKDAIKSKQDDLVVKEKQLGVEVLSGLRVPAAAADCWTPSTEWLLAQRPQYKIPAPKPAKKVLAKLAPPPPAPSGSGSYQVQAETERLVAKLKSDGFAPDVVQLTGIRSHLYRVRIGAYATLAEAQGHLADVDKRYNVVSAAVNRTEGEPGDTARGPVPGGRRHRHSTGLQTLSPMQGGQGMPVSFSLGWPLQPRVRAAETADGEATARPAPRRAPAPPPPAAPAPGEPHLTLSGLDSLAESLQRTAR